jgi:hypothetical protein
MLVGVQVINDHDAWAVGTVALEDSGGNDFNAMHWNGVRWEAVNILYASQGYLEKTNITWIYAIDSNNVWFGNSVRWSGSGFENMDQGTSVFYGIGTTHAWGDHGDRIFEVGNIGTIAYSPNRGSSWVKVEGGTTYNLFDVSSANGIDVFATGCDPLNNTGVLLKGGTSGFQVIGEGIPQVDPLLLFHPYFQGMPRTVWVSNQNTAYFGWSKLYKYTGGQFSLVRTLAGNSVNSNSDASYFNSIVCVRGIAENEMMIVGYSNTLRYFNGMNWVQLGTPYDGKSDIIWLALDMTEHLSVAVGWRPTTGNAVIINLEHQ